MEIIDVQKDLLKSKTIADFDRFENGDLFYNVNILDDLYQFPIPTIGEVHINHDILDSEGEQSGMKLIAKTFRPKNDVKGAAFTPQMRGSELFRWIKKAYNDNNLIKISE